jgi:CelD/BcsL family acetyltransferase involved in cellulose biosynthesis
MTLRIRHIDHARDFGALEPIWSRLTNETGQTSPFLSYDWFWCCWHGVVPQRHPEILVVEEGDTPVAIIPLMRWRVHLCGLPIRYISFLEWPHCPIAEMVISGQSRPIVELFLDYLAGRSDWDIARLQKLPATSPTLEALEYILPGRLSWHRERHLAYPYVTIDGDWQGFCTTMKKSSADTFQHIHATLERAGELRLEEHRLVDLQGSLFQEVLAVMNLQLRGSHVSTIMARQREFFWALTQRAAKNGWLSLWTLKLDNHVIAFEYQLHFHSTVQVLAAGEDPSYHALRPWPKLNLAILRVLFESGCSYEYRLGPAVQNDRLWGGNGQYHTVDLKLYRPGLYTRLLARLDSTRGIRNRVLSGE